MVVGMYVLCMHACVTAVSQAEVLSSAILGFSTETKMDKQSRRDENAVTLVTFTCIHLRQTVMKSYTA